MLKNIIIRRSHSNISNKVTQIRNYRSKPIFKLNFKNDLTNKTDEDEEINDNETFTSKVKSNNHSGDNAIFKSNRSNKRSRFNNAKQSVENQKVEEAMNQLNYKSPEQIKEELSLKFSSTGIEADPKFIDEMIVESQNEQELLKNYIQEPSETVDEITNIELFQYIDWLIDDGKETLKTQNEDKTLKNAILNKKLNEIALSQEADSLDADNLIKAFDTMHEITDNMKSSSLEELSTFLSYINKPENNDLTNLIPLEKILDLYMISTQLIDDEKRLHCIYYSGNLLYKALGSKSRPDPINEKFYIESLISHGDLNKAFKLYNSRKEKDVKNDRFWHELGVSIFLAKNNITQAITLTKDIYRKFGYVHHLVLIDGIKKSALLSESANGTDLEFWEILKSSMDNFGIIEQLDIPGPQIIDNRQTVFDYYNREDPVTWDALIETIFSFISKMNFDKAMEILTISVRRDKEFMYFFVENFIKSFHYSGRELFLQELENDFESNESKYHPAIREFLIDELLQIQKNRCSSLEEARLLESVNIYLTRLSKNWRILARDWKKLSKDWKLSSKESGAVRNRKMRIDDLCSSIRDGSPLTSFEINSLLSELLSKKSRTGYVLASRVLNQLHESSISFNNESQQQQQQRIFPELSSESYIPFFKYFLFIKRKPTFKEIKKLLSLMENTNTPMIEEIAMDILFAFRAENRNGDSIKFIQEYIFSDNKIALEKIYKVRSNHKTSLWSFIFQAYLKLVVERGTSRNEYEKHQKAFLFTVKHMIEAEMDDPVIIGDAITSAISFGDLETAICLVQWYGLDLKNDGFNIDFILNIKTTLELCLSKVERKLDDTNRILVTQKLEAYREKFGLYSIKSDLKANKITDWKTTARILLNFSELFAYAKWYVKINPLMTILPEEQIIQRKEKFFQNLKEMQKFYGLKSYEYKNCA